MTLLHAVIPGLKLVSEANSHTHFRERQKRAADQRVTVAAGLSRYAPPTLPAIVRIVRVAPCALDSDNLVGSAKHVRDEIARWLGVDDRDERVTWHVGQEKGAPREYAVKLHIRAWSPVIVGVRVRDDGLETHVAATLDAGGLAAVAVALAALARGEGTHVNFNIGEARFAFRRAEGAP